MPNETLRILRNARKLITDPAAWTKGSFKKDRPVTCYCAAGAVFEVARRLDSHRFTPTAPVFEALRRTPTFRAFVRGLSLGTQRLSDTVVFNDHEATTHADVLRLFDEAIAAEEERTRA